MKRLVDHGLARVRLWRGEIPNASYLAGEILERRVFPARQADEAKPSSVAIEVWLPMGPRALFGLLGIRYERNGPACEIRVPIVKGSEGPRLSDTIAAAYDEARVGLPSEYGADVVEWLARGAEAFGLQGNIAVECAAHSLVGSSRSVFAALSMLVTRLIVEDVEEQESGKIEERVREAMRRSAENRLYDPGGS